MAEPGRRGSKLRLIRFRLRTLLLITIPVGAVAAWFSNEVARCQREQAVIEATIDRMDERSRARMRDRLPLTLLYDYQLDDEGAPKVNPQPPAPYWFRKRFGEHLFAELKEIQVWTLQVNDFTGWDQLSGLEKLSVRGSSGDALPTGIGDLNQIKELHLTMFPGLSSLRSLAGLESLEKLRIEHCDSLSDLSGIRELENLRELSLEDCPSISSLNALFGLKLESFKMVDCRNVRELTGLRPENVRHLSIENCAGIDDIQLVSAMPNLATLRLNLRRDAQLPVNWSEVDYPTELTTVTLTGVAVNDLRWLSKCDGLNHLSIHRSGSLRDLHGLESCNRLNTLHLSCDNLTSLEGLPRSNNISIASIAGRSISNTAALGNLTELEKARILFQIDRITDLPNSEKLTSLEISLAPTVEDVDGFPNYPNLNFLGIYPASCLKNIRGLGHLRSLRDLNILNCESLESLDGLNGLHELRHLQLYDCRSLRTLNGLPASNNLTTVRLFSAEQLGDIDAITNVHKLTELSLDGAPAIRDCRVFSHLSKLEELDINQCKNLESLNGIDRLPSLDLLSIVDCTGLRDISALRQHPSLSTVSHRNCPHIDAAQWTMLMNRSPSIQLNDF